MKTLSKLVVLLSIVLFFNNCKQEASKIIVGTWKISDYTSSFEDQLVDPVVKENFNIQKKNTIESSSFVFNTDKSTVLTSDIGNSKGTWEITPDNKTLILKLEDRTINYAILEIESKKMVIEETMEEGKTVFTLVKQ